MSTTHPGPTVTIADAEEAIRAYLAERPYTSRFKAKHLANKTSLDASAKEVKHILSGMVSDGTLEKMSFSSGSSTYRVPDEAQFRSEAAQ